MRSNRNWCKLKLAKTCLYYDQVAWLPLSRAIKSYRELHSHTTYIHTYVPSQITKTRIHYPHTIFLAHHVPVYVVTKPECSSSSSQKPSIEFYKVPPNHFNEFKKLKLSKVKGKTSHVPEHHAIRTEVVEFEPQTFLTSTTGWNWIFTHHPRC
jgi:hypothetical protein